MPANIPNDLPSPTNDNLPTLTLTAPSSADYAQAWADPYAGIPEDDVAPQLAIVVLSLAQAFPPCCIPDEDANAITLALHSVIDRLIAFPAATASDVEAKLVAWTHLLENQCIMDLERWRQMVAEVSVVMRRPMVAAQ